MSIRIGLFEHFGLLLSFGGREDRGSFWPYAALVFGLMTSCNMLLSLSLMMSIGSIFETGMPPAIANFGLYFAVMGALGVLLYGAAVVRRLRDSGRSPWWAVMPLPFGAVSILGMVQIFGATFDGVAPDSSLIELMMVSYALYPLTIIALIGMLTVRSAPRSADGKAARAIPVYHEE